MVLASAVAVPLIGRAQTQGDGGVTVRLGVTQSLEANDNLGLATNSDGTTVSAVTSLSFGLASETRTSRIALDAAVGLRAVDGPGTSGVETEPGNSSVALSFGHDAAGAAFDVSVRLAQSEIGFARSLEDIFVAGLPLPTDFGDLTGTGTRRALSFDATLSLRDDAPFGVTLRAGSTDLSYRDVTSSALVDSRRTMLGATARLDITPVLQATLGVTGTRNDEDGAALRDTVALEAGATITRPDGSYGLNLSATDTDDGRQYGLTFARDIEFRSATLAAEIGATRAVGGDIYLTAALDYRLEGTAGELAIGLDRRINSDRSGSEEVRTSFSVSADYALTPQTTLGLALALARNEGLGTDVVDLGISFDRTLTPDWSLSARYSYEQRTADGSGTAEANTLSLSLTRNFDLRY